MAPPNVLHQLLNWLRAKHTYNAYASIGHSSAGATVVNEAATYHDVDKVVITGIAHNPSPSGIATATAATYPAAQDPLFSGLNLDAGYKTTIPGRRIIFFSNIADPAVIAFSEQHKDAFSSTEFRGAVTQTFAPAAGNIANSVTAPIMIVLGQEDSLFCGPDSPVTNCSSETALGTLEQPYFNHAQSLTVKTIPQTGHDIVLHPTNPLSFFEINKWIETH